MLDMLGMLPAMSGMSGMPSKLALLQYSGPREIRGC